MPGKRRIQFASYHLKRTRTHTHTYTDIYVVNDLINVCAIIMAEYIIKYAITRSRYKCAYKEKLSLMATKRKNHLNVTYSVVILCVFKNNYATFLALLKLNCCRVGC